MLGWVLCPSGIRGGASKSVLGCAKECIAPAKETCTEWLIRQRCAAGRGLAVIAGRCTMGFMEGFESCRIHVMSDFGQICRLP